MLAIAAFELKTKLKRVSTYVYFFLFAVLAALWMAAAGGVFASASVSFSSDKVFINSPYALAQTITVLGVFGMVTVAAMMGRAVQQDFEYETHHFFFTAPIRKADYVIGRFLGTVALSLLVLTGIALGAWIGANLPGIEPTRVGPWSLAAVIQPYLLLLLPNLLVLGGCFFMLGALGRRMLPVYAAGAVVLIGYIIALQLLQDIENRKVAALVDPFGSVAMGLVTRYWSPAEKNTLLVPLAGDLLWNRLLWGAVGTAVFVLGYLRFGMRFETTQRRTRAKAPAETREPAAMSAAALPVASADVRGVAYLRQLPGLVALHLRETVKSVYFLAILGAAVLFVLGMSKVLGSMYGTNTHPVTWRVVESTLGSFTLFALIITAIYAGELVWRERDARVALITDSTPAPSWLAFAAKLAALFAVQALLLAVVMACGILVQLFQGYTRIEPGQYLFRLFVLELPEVWLSASLALTIHVVVNNKYLGHFIVVLLYVVLISAAGFGFNDRLYLFGSGTGQVPYSDMNGFGHFLGTRNWFLLYWSAFCVMLLAAARLLWVRGTDTAWHDRLRIARGRLTPAVLTVSGLAAVAFVSTGAWIFYNTHVLHPFRTEFQQGALQAEYERLYKPLATNPQPKIVAAKVFADIHPHEHRVRFTGD